MKKFKRSRNEWLILLFLPLGVASMLCAGQAAINQPAAWSVKADMGSYIDPNSYVEQRSVAPLLSGIMTQPAWMDRYAG